jgi:hypothetical protein
VKNTNHHLKLLAACASVAAVGAAWSSNAAAAIISTGGTLTGVSPSTVGTGTPSFDATQSGNVDDFNPSTGQTFEDHVTYASASGSIGPSGLSLNTQAQTFYSALTNAPQLQGNVTGTLGFDVTEAETATFSWANIFSTASPMHGSLEIKSSGGSVVLGCVVQGLEAGVGGGCEVGTMPSATNGSTPLAKQGSFDLAAGEYSLLFSVNSGTNFGYPDNAGYDFSMNVTPVPLPAGLPLLLSGLAAFGASSGLTRRPRA